MVIRQLLLLVTRHLRKYLVNQSTFDKKSLLNHTLFCTESPTPTPNPSPERLRASEFRINMCVFIFNDYIYTSSEVENRRVQLCNARFIYFVSYAWGLATNVQGNSMQYIIIGSDNVLTTKLLLQK